jgi:hypothetical protein
MAQEKDGSLSRLHTTYGLETKSFPHCGDCFNGGQSGGICGVRRNGRKRR